MRIFGWPHGDDGCSYYRVHLPFERLKAEGLDVDWRQVMQERDVVAADVLLGQRLVDPIIRPYWQEWQRRRSPRLVADLDDDLFKVPDWSPGFEVYRDPEVLDTMKFALALADRVTVSTEPLAAVVREFNENVFVVPNGVPPWLTKWKRTVRSNLVVGWAGSPSHVEDIARYRTWGLHDSEVHIIGGDPTWFNGVKNFRYTSWVYGVENYLKAIDFDICVIPLKTDETFNRSKSGVKAMEMAALGIPVVATYCDAYRDVVYHGVTGFLVHNADEMAWRVEQLVTDDGLREEMGKAARDYAARNFTTDQTWRRWELALTFPEGEK